MLKRILRPVTDYPVAVLLVVALLTVFALSRIVDFRTGQPNLRLDSSVNRLMPEEDEGRLFYDRVRRIFGSDETLVVALVADDVFQPAVLSSVERLTERLGQLDGVHHVVSLANALDIRSAGDDLLIEPFLTEVPEDAAGLAEIRKRALDNPIYSGNLVASSGKATALVVYLMDMSEREFIDRGIDEQIGAIVEEERGEAEAWITGPPRIKAETSRVLLADLRFVIPAAFSIASLIALISFRTLRGVIVPAGTIVIALLWTLGAMAAAGRPLNLVTTILPPLLLTIGFAYAVHIVSDYYDALREHEGDELPDPREITREALGHVALPVALTALTTGAGFLALTVASISAIQEFGVFATFGTAATAVVSLTFAPALLALLPVPRKLAAQEDEGWIGRAAERLARFDLSHRREVLAAGLVVALISVWGMTRIEISNDLVTNFYPDAPVRIHFEAINDSLEGSNPFYVVFETQQRDAFKEPSNLRTLEAFQAWLDEQPEVGSSTSLVDYVKLINRGFHDDDPEYLRIPETRAMTTQLLFFGGNDELGNFVDSRYERANVLVRSRVIDSIELGGLATRIEAYLAEIPDFAKATVTGNSVLVARTIDDIARGQAQSILIAFAVIYLILAALFTSFRIGLIALIPNALPVLVYFGALGISGVKLSAITGLVACIVLGIAVDDTIHYITRFNAEARRLANERDGTIAALRGVARPVTYTTVALVLGFTTLTFCNLRSQVEFGALGAFTLFVAWVIDVTFTPALCSGVRIVSLWDVLTLDLGADPQRSIPIFEGLSRARARVVALMTRLQSFSKGHRLFSAGDQGQDMYVVIEGELEVSIPKGSQREVLHTLRRGESFGEVGLFHGTRTADVDAVSDVRLMRLNESNLARLRRRYPRIGAQVYRNLSCALAEIVARSTERERVQKQS